MNRVRKFRKDKGLTQTQLARLTGLPINTISSLERKNSNLQRLTAQLISKALGVSIPVLTGHEEENHIWIDAEYYPKKDGEYLVAYKIRNYNDYHFKVLTFKNDNWWITSDRGEIQTSFGNMVLWWSEINNPPV